MIAPCTVTLDSVNMTRLEILEKARHRLYLAYELALEADRELEECDAPARAIETRLKELDDRIDAIKNA